MISSLESIAPLLSGSAGAIALGQIVRKALIEQREDPRKRIILLRAKSIHKKIKRIT
jgi:hypothetical protein